MYWKITAMTLLVASTAISAAETKPADKPAAAPDKGDEIVCTLDTSTGSHIPKKTCTTRAQAEEARKRDQEAVQRMHKQGTAANHGS